MGQTTSKTNEDKFTPIPSGRAEVDQKLAIPDEEKYEIPAESLEKTEELLDVIRSMDKNKKQLTLAEFQEKLTTLDFNDESDEDGDKKNGLTQEEFDEAINKVRWLLTKGATALPIDDGENSALFECVLRNNLPVMEEILSYRVEDLKQTCNGLSILEATVVYKNFPMFRYLTINFNEEVNTFETGTLACLIKVAGEFGWSEELAEHWFNRIKPHLGEADYRSMETLTGPQFDVALELLPDLMEDIRLNDPNNGIKAEELL